MYQIHRRPLANLTHAKWHSLELTIWCTGLQFDTRTLIRFTLGSTGRLPSRVWTLTFGCKFSMQVLHGKLHALDPLALEENTLADPGSHKILDLCPALWGVTFIFFTVWSGSGWIEWILVARSSMTKTRPMRMFFILWLWSTAILLPSTSTSPWSYTESFPR